MKRAWTTLAALALLTGCGNADLMLHTTDWALDPDDPESPPVKLSSWQSVSDGLPANSQMLETAHLDGTLYALVKVGSATSIYGLASGATSWVPGGPTLRSGEQPMCLTRLDVALYVCGANGAAGRGSLWKLEFSDEPWRPVTQAPDLPIGAVVKKSGALLIAVFGSTSYAGIYASTDKGASWTRRSDATGGATFLRQPVRSFAAASAAQRIFAAGAAGTVWGGLHYSDDSGVTWADAQLSGEVRGLAAGGQFVLVDTASNGPQRSDNYGNTFHATNLGARGQSFLVSGSRAFAGTSTAGVRVSSNGGATWRDASTGLPQGASVTTLYLAGSSLVISLGDGKVFLAEVAQ